MKINNITILAIILFGSCSNESDSFRERRSHQGATSSNQTIANNSKEEAPPASSPIDPGNTPSGTQTPQQPVTPTPPSSPMYFNIMISQTVQAQSDYFLYFYPSKDTAGNLKQETKPKLEVEFIVNGENKKNIYQHGLNGMENAFGYHYPHTDSIDNKKHSLYIRKQEGKSGFFLADISDIPKDASINKAIVFFTLEGYEGIASGDRSSEFTVYHFPKLWNWSGNNPNPSDKAEEIKKLYPGPDFFDKGHYEWKNPTVPFDFTEYAKKLQSKR